MNGPQKHRNIGEHLIRPKKGLNALSMLFMKGVAFICLIFSDLNCLSTSSRHKR